MRDLNNRNDIFSELAITIGRANSNSGALKRAEEADDKLPAMAAKEATGALEMTVEMQQKLKDKTTLMMQRRVDRWDAVMERRRTGR
jgi:hypothetical protein